MSAQGCTVDFDRQPADLFPVFLAILRFTIPRLRIGSARPIILA